MDIQEQTWSGGHTRHLIIDKHGSVSLDTYDNEKESAYINQLWVDEGHRNLGIGRELLNAAISKCMAKEKKQLTLYISMNAPCWLYRWYERLGFVFIEATNEFNYEVHYKMSRPI